jgi:hypothetical protein
VPGCSEPRPQGTAHHARADNGNMISTRADRCEPEHQ